MKGEESFFILHPSAFILFRVLTILQLGVIVNVIEIRWLRMIRPVQFLWAAGGCGD